jgi:hypothetical protein
MVKTRTKAQLKQSHDNMARLLIEICSASDEVWAMGLTRSARASRQYKRALGLSRAAGFKYDPAHR